MSDEQELLRDIDKALTSLHTWLEANSDPPDNPAARTVSAAAIAIARARDAITNTSAVMSPRS